MNPIVDNLPVAQDGDSWPVDSRTSWPSIPRRSPSPQAHQPLLTLLAKDPASAAKRGQRRRLAGQHRRRRRRRSALKGLSQLAKFKTPLEDSWSQPYTAQLTFIQAHQARLDRPAERLERGADISGSTGSTSTWPAWSSSCP